MLRKHRCAQSLEPTVIAESRFWNADGIDNTCQSWWVKISPALDHATVPPNWRALATLWAELAGAARRTCHVSRSSFVGLLLGLALVAVGLFPTVSAEAKARRSGCRAQKPQRFLMRSSYVRRGMLDPKAHDRAVRYRVAEYGSIPGIGATESNPDRVSAHTRTTSFFGLPIVMHEKVVPALECVERRITQRCTSPESHYEPRSIGGLRTENTIRQGEIFQSSFRYRDRHRSESKSVLPLREEVARAPKVREGVEVTVRSRRSAQVLGRCVSVLRILLARARLPRGHDALRVPRGSR
ncbi:MAG: hypothetical protein QM784_02190 [Polyangiaceae bacterium]